MTERWLSYILLFLTIHESFGDEQSFTCLQLGAQENPKIGVLLDPYTHTAQGSENDVYEMLKILAVRGFRQISTLALNETTNHVRTAIIPAVTQFNNLNNSRTLSLYPAFSIHKTTVENDIINTIETVNKANAEFSETIAGVVIYTDPDSAATHLEQMKLKVQKLNQPFPPLGVSSEYCLPDVEKDVKEKSDGWKLLQQVRFIFCQKLPTQTDSPENEANEVIEYMKSTKKILTDANLTVEVIGMTGWSSKLNDDGTVEGRGLLRRFWCQIEKKSQDFNITIHMIHAFQAPPPLRSDEDSNIRPPIYHIPSDYGWWLPLIDKQTDTVDFKERVNYEEATPIPVYEIVTVSIVGFLILVFSLVIILLYYKLRKAKSLLSAKEIDEFRNGVTEAQTDADDHTEDALKLPYDTSYEIPKSKFQIEKANFLGKGAFGVVYRGKLDGYDKQIAFKTTSADTTKNSFKNMLREIKIMIHVGKHPNVVSIIGAHTGDIEGGSVWIALEMCDLGSLESYLKKFRADFLQRDSTDFSASNSSTPLLQEQNSSSRYTIAPTLTTAFSQASPETFGPQLLKWAHDIASGMEHIASKHIIHADLAARNVLLSFDKTAKITDFGLSRRLYEYKLNYTIKGAEPLPWRWMAIESLEEMRFSTKSDVWSYAVTLYELFSLGLTPHPGLTWTVGFTDQIKSGELTITKPEYATDEIYNLMVTCWEINPNRRPNFTSLKKSLENLILLSNLRNTEPNSYMNVAPLLPD